jgi:membrane associated rhomboid family serine protease
MSSGVDPYELEDKAHGFVSAISWLIWSGIYPVYSDAIGNHKPYATWAIAAITVLVSIWFSVLDFSGSPQMASAKNLMLWSNNAGEPDAETVYFFYDYTSYGDSDAFFSKLDELSRAEPESEGVKETRNEDLDAFYDEIGMIRPDDKLVLAAHNALRPDQQYCGKFKLFQLLTHAFLHAGPMHLAGNMLFLLVLGTRVNAAIGNIATAILYPIMAMAAAVTHLMSIGAGEPPTPMLGASGAVMGLAGMNQLSLKATISCNSTVASLGKPATVTAARACWPASPRTSTRKSLAPLITCELSENPGLP